MARSSAFRLSVALAAGLAAAALAGCGGPKTADVTGKVTVKGKAPNVPGLTINFLGSDGRPVVAEVAADGSYAARGVPVGEVKVGFAVADAGAEAAARSGRPDPAALGEDGNPKASPERDALRAKAERASAAPAGPAFLAKYNDPVSSGLTTTVAADKPNEYNPDLK